MSSLPLPLSLDTLADSASALSERIDTLLGGQHTSVSRKVLVVTGGALASYQLVKASYFLYRHFFCFGGLPRLKNPSWLAGNFVELTGPDTLEVQKEWVREHGQTFVVNYILGGKRLFTTDAKAIAHILATYPRSDEARLQLARVMAPGHGLFNVEGEGHKIQRKVMNPAFGPIQLRDLTHIFVEKANSLRDAWLDQIGDAPSKRINVVAWLVKMTLDVIGLAGFNYHFNALKPNSGPNELNDAFNYLFRADENPTKLFLGLFLPFIDWIPTERGRGEQRALDTMGRIGRELLTEAKAAAIEEQRSGVKSRARDLLSLLVKANMAEGANKMCDNDVLAQIPTFLLAGHETTSTSTSWTLFSLAQNPAVQTRLREELRTLGTDTPTMDELAESSLPYLDAVAREALRLHSPIPFAARKAPRDDVIPLAHPYTDGRGRVHRELRLNKEDSIIIPIYAMNTTEEVWGPDATSFNPDRWLEGGAAAPQKNGLPGLWGNQMTFTGGMHSCIGYRFSLFEMKALLFSLVKAFEFELATPVEDVGVQMFIVRRPMLKSDKEGGAQLPLLIKPVQS
ncbi:cytochrome P450 [Coniophora puteana RWD-64-598 SS2]|uniref:Cytochrome P450 n=1 Tax=Coniophora puteana (strain RWD-64-598) TaxID=741705 RepID=A0A5M3MAE1_CONPW|nr:cytochrome P450 [Coniophora puteana RWD-64-598 SS2]EIW75595.1 cytochrome P450 [Coniophora puteana RWD-64-598 SS2]